MKQLLKSLVEILMTVAFLPLVCLYFLMGLFFKRNNFFPAFSQFVSLFPGITGAYIRRTFYRFTLTHCKPGSFICFGTIFSSPGAAVGQFAYIGAFCCIGDVDIGNDVLIGSHVSIMNGSRQHGIERLDIPVREQGGSFPKIQIGEDTWIGDRAIVMADVGKHCVVGAGAVVDKPLPDFAISVGNPARIIRYRGTTSKAQTKCAE